MGRCWYGSPERLDSCKALLWWRLAVTSWKTELNLTPQLDLVTSRQAPNPGTDPIRPGHGFRC